MARTPAEVEALRKRVAEIPSWYHCIDLGGGFGVAFEGGEEGDVADGVGGEVAGEHPEDAVEELTALKLMTTPSVLSKTNRLMITDTVGKLKGVKAILDAFQP